MVVFPRFPQIAVVCCSVFASGFLFSGGGCREMIAPGPKPNAPPIEFSFRKSKIPGQGMVAGVRNTSEHETLENFVVKVTAPDEKGTRSYRIDVPVQPQDSITVGWTQLDGWKLKPGQTLSVTCEQYRDAATILVPEPN